MGGVAWLQGATNHYAASFTSFTYVDDGTTITMTGQPGGSALSGSGSSGGTATGGNMLNESGTGNQAGTDSERGFNTLAPLKRLGLGAEACASGSTNSGNAGGIYIKEYSDASASLVGEKLVSHQMISEFMFKDPVVVLREMVERLPVLLVEEVVQLRLWM